MEVTVNSVSAGEMSPRGVVSQSQSPSQQPQSPRHADTGSPTSVHSANDQFSPQTPPFVYRE